MLYTSYYSNPLLQKNRDNYILLQISNSAPYSVDAKLGCVIPDWREIVRLYKRGKIDIPEYTQRYRVQLNKNFEAIKEILTGADKLEKDVVLLCYESAGDFCHRHILADWITENLGIQVKEL